MVIIILIIDMEDIKKNDVYKKCCVINEYEDLEEFYGMVSDVLLLKMKNLEIFNKYLEYRWLNDFILHFYRSDKMEADIIIGVNRHDNCSILEMDEKKLFIRIKVNTSNMKHYNMSELKLLRKDKIGSILSDKND
jgi:hypothetical protein